MDSSFNLNRVKGIIDCLSFLLLLFYHATANSSVYSAAIFFGDSLTDSGTFAALGVVPAGTGKFTTIPGLIWAENIAHALNTTATPAVAGGTNYAVGGARIANLPGIPPIPPTANAPPLSAQINSYLLSTGGTAQSSALYTVWGGANDIFFSAGAPNAPAYLMATAQQDAECIIQLQNAGAQYLIVPTVPDIGATPFGVAQGLAAAENLTSLSKIYNDALYQRLANSGVQVIPVDTFSLLHEVTADPARYGLINISTPACGLIPALLCTQADFIVPNAQETYLYADDVHPTTAGPCV